jgi:hypothetical protein
MNHKQDAKGIEERERRRGYSQFNNHPASSTCLSACFNLARFLLQEYSKKKKEKRHAF